MKAAPEYKIYFNDTTANEWIAVEKHPNEGSFMARMEFCGYGSTPEAALEDIQRAHKELEMASRKCVEFLGMGNRKNEV